MTTPIQPPGMRQSPTVFIIDDDLSIRQLLLLHLQHAGISAEAFGSAETFLDAVTPQTQGCLLLDISLPGISGTELQTELTRRGIYLPIVFLSGRVDVPIAAAVMKRGAFDVIEKPFDGLAVVEVVRAALKASAAAVETAAESARIARMKATLTARESEVAELIAQGLSNKQIASALNISDRTVEIHKSRVMDKMHTDNLATFALRWTAVKSVNRIKE
jgi:two-component system response regulator FixJ